MITTVLSLIASLLYIWIIAAYDNSNGEAFLHIAVCPTMISVLLFAPAAGSLIRLLVAFFSLVIGYVKEEEDLPYMIVMCYSFIESIIVLIGMIVSFFL